ncbi:MAG TPA: methionine adenosyltransferase [Candidatus Binatia bacterium]|nr:methionine adenosyltransferase [Candidatus Binatia bacterium]
MRAISVETFRSQRPSEQRVEVVERKGLGHPDSICDAVAEAISIALSQEYLRRFGRVLHHNIDKGLLIAGAVEHDFGGGRQTQPMRLIIGDRATIEFRGERVAVGDLAIATAQDWMRTHLRHVDPVRHLIYESALAAGSRELSGIFSRESAVLGANDTSAAVGYFPLTDAERAVLATERYLNSGEFKGRFPDTGEDVKVLGVRTQDRLQLTIAMPLIEKCISDEAAYFDRKAEIVEAVTRFAEGQRGTLADVQVALNHLDRRGRGLDGVYLSLLGTSAEDADSGEVGRGNRVNGLTSLNRPASAEAAPGKNPVSHVGKIYNVLAFRLAERIYREVRGVTEVWVWLCSRIGEPIDQPAVAAVQYAPEGDGDFATIQRLTTELIDAELSAITDFTRDLAAGRYAVS